jgi:hypothetical protein
MVKTIREVNEYVAARLEYNGVPFKAYHAGTGSAYFMIGRHKLRVSDHPWVYDDYRYVIRCDCKAPVPVRGKLIVPAELADVAIDAAIREYSPVVDQAVLLQKVAMSKEWTKAEAKKIDIELLLLVVRHNRKGGATPSKIECLKAIAADPGLVWEYYDTCELDCCRHINAEK